MIASKMATPFVLMLCLALTCCGNEAQRIIGSDCVEDGECASSRCDELRCKAANPASAGERCTHPLECASENCVEGVCEDGTRPLAAACTQSAQCVTANCHAGRCAAPGAGADGSMAEDGSTALDSSTRPPDMGPDLRVDARVSDFSQVPLEITSTPVMVGTPKLPYVYDAEVNTDDPVVWRLTKGPGGMAIDAETGYVLWQVPTTGTYDVTIEVARGGEVVEQPYMLMILQVTPNGLRPEELFASPASRAEIRQALAGHPLPIAIALAEVRAALEDVGSRRVLSYIASCALRSNQRLVVQAGVGSWEAGGEMGLAPGWWTAACDQACRERVSACLFARLNATGRPRSISIGGASALRGSESEGVFFGDYFASAPRRFVCRAAGATVAAQQGGRVCADRPASCGLRGAGDCFRACSAQGCRAPDGQRYAYPLVVGR